MGVIGGFPKESKPSSGYFDQRRNRREQKEYIDLLCIALQKGYTWSQFLYSEEMRLDIPHGTLMQEYLEKTDD